MPVQWGALGGVDSAAHLVTKSTTSFVQPPPLPSGVVAGDAYSAAADDGQQPLAGASDGEEQDGSSSCSCSCCSFAVLCASISACGAACCLCVQESYYRCANCRPHREA